MSSDGSFENLSNIEMDSGELVKQDASNQMILQELSAIRQLIDSKPASDVPDIHMALITKFTNLTIEHEELKKATSAASSEYKALIEIMKERLEHVNAGQMSAEQQLSSARAEIQSLKAKIRELEQEKKVVGSCDTEESVSDEQAEIDRRNSYFGESGFFQRFPEATATSPAVTQLPSVINPQIVEINRRLKEARTPIERVAIFGELKMNPILFHAWMRQPKE